MGQLFTQTYTNERTSWLVCGWNTFGAQTNHVHTQIQKTHHDLNLGAATTFPLQYFLCLFTGCAPKCHFLLGLPSWDSRVESPKIFEIGTFATLEAHNFLCRPPIEVRSKTKL